MNGLIAVAALISALLADPGPACAQARFWLDHYHLESSHLDSAWVTVTQARTDDPADEVALALQARIAMAVGDRSVNRSAKLTWYRRSRVAADSLRQLNDANPEGHLWWAAASGLVGLQEGMLSSLWMLPGIRRELERALALDSGCVWAYTGLGALYRRVPSVAGGSRARARSYLEAGLARFPNATDMRLELARLELDEGRRSRAHRELEELIACQNPSCPAAFELDDRPEAQRLLLRLSD